MGYLCCFKNKNKKKNKIKFSSWNEYFSNSDNSCSTNDTLTEAIYTENPLAFSHENTVVNTETETETDIEEYVKNKRYTTSIDEQGWSEIHSVQRSPEASQHDECLEKAATDGRQYLYT